MYIFFSGETQSQKVMIVNREEVNARCLQVVDFIHFYKYIFVSYCRVDGQWCCILVHTSMESVSLFIIQFSANMKKEHDSMEVCAKKQEYWPSKLYVGVLDISFIYYHVHPQILRPSAAPAFAALVNQGRGPQGRNFERKLRNFECSGKCYLKTDSLKFEPEQ